MPQRKRRNPRDEPGPSLFRKRGGAARDDGRAGDFRAVHRVAARRAHSAEGRAVAALVSVVGVVPLAVAAGLLQRAYHLEQSRAYRLLTSVRRLAPGWMAQPTLADLGLGAAPKLQSFLIATPEWGVLRDAGYGIPPEPGLHDESPRDVVGAHVSLGREMLRLCLGGGWTLAQDEAAVEALAAWPRRNWAWAGPAGRYTRAAEAVRDGQLRWVEGARLAVLLPPPDPRDAADARTGTPLVRPPVLLLGGGWTPDADLGRLAPLLRLLGPFDVVCCARAAAGERDPYVAAVRRRVRSPDGLDLGRTVTDYDPTSGAAVVRPEACVRVLPPPRGVEWQRAWARLHAAVGATDDEALTARLEALLASVL